MIYSLPIVMDDSKTIVNATINLFVINYKLKGWCDRDAFSDACHWIIGGKSGFLKSIHVSIAN